MNLLHQQDMKYKLVIFDFDGTIADTSLGILDSHRFALAAMGKEVPCEKELRTVIGGNLLQIYINRFGFGEDKAREAVSIYRSRYAENGIHMATLYPGFEMLLSKLKENDYKIGVATLKAEKFAKIMLSELGVDSYFDAVCGMDEYDGLTKALLIEKCCDLCGVEKSKAVLVGDSNNDLLGAKEAGVRFVGVTYGFGFSKDKNYCFNSADTTEEVLAIIEN